MAAFTPIGVDAQVRGLGAFTRNLGKMDRSIQKTGKRTKSVGKQFTDLGSKVLGMGATMAKVAAGAVVGLGTAVAGLGVVSVKTAISVESAFAGVIKTTDGLVDSAGELTAVGAEIRQGFRDLAKEVPVAVEELLGIGEIAGQLGVGKEALIDFTRTVADLGVATNLTTEEAAFNLARIANIFGVETKDMGKNSQRLGSTIVDLGNNFATTERDITAFAERIAGAGKIAGLTQADILAIGTAMSSVGVQAEAGGTAVQKVLLAMNEAVVGTTTSFVDNSKAIDKNEDKLLDLNAQLVKLEAQTGIAGDELWNQFEAFKAAGGAAADFGRELGDTRRAQLFKTTRAIQDLSTETDLLRENQGRPITAEGLETFARTAGLTAAEFKELWQEDASKAFELFVLGLGEQGDAAIGTLDELGLTDQRLVRSFLSLAGAGDLLTDALALGEEAWAENTALAEEAEKRYRTTESQLLLLKNQLRDVAITIGDPLLPLLNELVQAARPIIEELGKQLPGALESVISKIRELQTAFAEGGLGGLVNAIVSEIQEAWPIIAEALTVWGERFWNWIKEVAVPLATEKLGELTEAFEKVWPDIKETLTGWGEMFWDWVEETAIPQATEKLTALAEAINAWASSSETAAQMQQLGETLADNIITAITNFTETDGSQRMALAFVNALISVARAIPAAAATIGSNIVQGVITSIGEKLGIDLESIFTDILSALGVADAELWGERLADALAAGFESALETAMAAINPAAFISQSVSDAIAGLGEIKTALGGLKPPNFLAPGSPTPFEIGLVGIASALAGVISASLQTFSAQALAVFTQVRILVQGLDTALTLIWEVTLPQLQITTQVTADSMVVALNQVSEAVSQLNTLLGQTVSLLQAIAAAAAAAAKAMTEGFDAAAESISGDLIEALEELRDILEDVKTEAEAAASAVNDIGRGTPTAGAGVGPGFQRGANFTVPSGFPGDSFRMGVTTGERVIVIPPGEPAPAGVGGETNFIMNINSLASPTAVIQQFEVMQALVS